MLEPYEIGSQLRLRRDCEGLSKDTIVFVSHYADQFPPAFLGGAVYKADLMYFKDFDIPFVFNNGRITHEELFLLVAGPLEVK